MTEDVLPVPAPGSALLRVQGTSRLAFGATTAALVTLASGGTALLVNYGASNIGTATSLPSGAALPAPPADGGGVVVARPAGTFQAKAPRDATIHALKNALAHRRVPGRRTLTAPLVALAPPLLPVTPVLGPVTGPFVGPVTGPFVGPVIAPPLLPPVVTVPGSEPRVVPVSAPALQTTSDPAKAKQETVKHATSRQPTKHEAKHEAKHQAKHHKHRKGRHTH